MNVGGKEGRKSRHPEMADFISAPFGGLRLNNSGQQRTTSPPPPGPHSPNGDFGDGGGGGNEDTANSEMLLAPSEKE